MNHICPACGKQWECDCDPNVIIEHYRETSGHHVEIGCSEKCAEHLRALLAFLRRYGL